jgi:hypothetical protein
MRLTLDEAAELFDWLEFCKITGFSEWARAEGGGHIEASLTVDEVKRLTGRATVREDAAL